MCMIKWTFVIEIIIYILKIAILSFKQRIIWKWIWMLHQWMTIVSWITLSWYMMVLLNLNKWWLLLLPEYANWHLQIKAFRISCSILADFICQCILLSTFNLMIIRNQLWLVEVIACILIKFRLWIIMGRSESLLNRRIIQRFIIGMVRYTS